jgi:hypothetical protein
MINYCQTQLMVQYQRNDVNNPVLLNYIKYFQDVCLLMMGLLHMLVHLLCQYGFVFTTWHLYLPESSKNWPP